MSRVCVQTVLWIAGSKILSCVWSGISDDSVDAVRCSVLQRAVTARQSKGVKT